MVFCILSQAEFLEHARQVEGKSFLQSGEMAELLRKRGGEVRFLGYRQPSDQVQVSALAYCRPMTGGFYMAINGGPLVSDSSYLAPFLQGLKEYAKGEKVLELVIKPHDTYQTFDSLGQATGPENQGLIDLYKECGFQHDGLLTGYPGGEPDWHYVKNLDGVSQTTLVNSFSKKGKVLSKKANSFGITVRQIEKGELFRFKAITAETSERQDYVDKQLDYYEDFFDAFGRRAKFLIASINFQEYLANLSKYQDRLGEKVEKLTEDLQSNPASKKKQNELRELRDQVASFEQRKNQARKWLDDYGEQSVDIAASLFVYSEDELVYLFSGSLTDFSNFYAPIILQEFAMAEAIKQSLTVYNFLGIQGVFDGSDGVLRFKQHFNGSIIRKVGTFRFYPFPLKYRMIQSIKKLLGRN